jgi:hypothetical protein
MLGKEQEMGAFSVFKDRRSNRNKRETPTVEGHYTKLAKRTAAVRYVCMFLILLFAAYSFSFHSNEITMENFRYMMKFINLGDDADSPGGTFLSFDGGEGNRGLIFKGDLAVVNEGGLTITGWDGEVILRSNFSYEHPQMTENGNFLFCYDVGGKDLKIFNSYQQMPDSPTFDYPISWLAASPHGEYAVASSAKSYRSAVYVFDSENRIRYSQKFGDTYVDFVDISSDGSEFITAAHYCAGGNLITVVSKFRLGVEGPVFSKEFVGEMPLGIYYTDRGFGLMTTDSIKMFDGENNVIADIDISSKELLSGKFFGDKALFTFSTKGLSGGTEAIVYSADGGTLSTKTFRGSLLDLLVCGDMVYALSPGEIIVYSFTTEEENTYKVPSSYSALISNGEKVILFSENQAEYFNTANFAE